MNKYFSVGLFRLMGGLSALVLAFTGCTKDAPKNSLNGLLSDSQNIVSTRPQNSKQFIAILKLKNPALFETAQKVNNKAVIDQQVLKDITDEQQAVITSLNALSSEIQVMYRYRMILNGLAILAPIELSDKIKSVAHVVYSESAGNFSLPQIMSLGQTNDSPPFAERNSAKFIGAEKLNLSGITGKGIHVGIIDTGIDYTHAMFKGVGTEEAYKAIRPSEASVGFPNDRVVGGIDLVGTEFDSASPEFTKRIPHPDMNPLDEAGHGTHVAGTVAGLGDGVRTYNGMAPEAVLHAIKVFGAEGSTSDAVVIAALEYSADPNHDGDNSDQLDVVNMSLGSGYGNPHILYSEAIKNLVNGGTVVVASAGNSGHTDYIVGAPSVSDDALSVAASVDNGDQNWKFNTSKIILGDANTTLLVEAIEAATSKKIAQAPVRGPLVYIGNAADDLTEEQKSAVKGKVALIDRGLVTFNEKFKRAAAAGAIGVVVANNASGAPMAMGTTDPFDFPGIMITKEDGQKIKETLKNPAIDPSTVIIEFQSPDKIEKPEFIDTLTSFTSKGPRSIDGAIKPEISAPGSNVISAKMGGGNASVQMSGTSMAAPHMAGVMALVKQAHPELSALQLKSLVMGTAKTIGEKGQRYSVSLQGSGRVQADVAATALLVSDVSAISLGETAIESQKVFRRTLQIKNISTTDLSLKFSFDGNGYISLSPVNTLLIKVGETQSVSFNLTLDATQMKDESIREMDGWIKISRSEDQTSQEIYRIPVLAVAHKLSAIRADSLVVQASSSLDANGALATLKLQNKNQNTGVVELFNLISRDERKPGVDSYMSNDCDLQAAGYRIIERQNEKDEKDEKDEKEQVIQFAIKTYKPMTTWNTCDVSILIDADQDGVAEQELLGSTLKSIPGQKAEDFATTLLDATKARELRKKYEADVEAVKNDPVKLNELKEKEKYDEAILDQRPLLTYNNSTVVVLEAVLKQLAKNREGNLAFKVVVTHNDQGAIEMDDYLAQSLKTNMKISLQADQQSYKNLPQAITVKGGSELSIDLTKGSGVSQLLVLMPQNNFSTSDLLTDLQSQMMKPTYKVQP